MSWWIYQKQQDEAFKTYPPELQKLIIKGHLIISIVLAIILLAEFLK